MTELYCTPDQLVIAAKQYALSPAFLNTKDQHRNLNRTGHSCVSMKRFVLTLDQTKKGSMTTGTEEMETIYLTYMESNPSKNPELTDRDFRIFHGLGDNTDNDSPTLRPATSMIGYHRKPKGKTYRMPTHEDIVADDSNWGVGTAIGVVNGVQVTKKYMTRGDKIFSIRETLYIYLHYAIFHQGQDNKGKLKKFLKKYIYCSVDTVLNAIFMRKPPADDDIPEDGLFGPPQPDNPPANRPAADNDDNLALNVNNMTLSYRPINTTGSEVFQSQFLAALKDADEVDKEELLGMYELVKPLSMVQVSKLYQCKETILASLTSDDVRPVERLDNKIIVGKPATDTDPTFICFFQSNGMSGSVLSDGGDAAEDMEDFCRMLGYNKGAYSFTLHGNSDKKNVADIVICGRIGRQSGEPLEDFIRILKERPSEQQPAIQDICFEGFGTDGGDFAMEEEATQPLLQDACFLVIFQNYWFGANEELLAEGKADRRFENCIFNRKGKYLFENNDKEKTVEAANWTFDQCCPSVNYILKAYEDKYLANTTIHLKNISKETKNDLLGVLVLYPDCLIKLRACPQVQLDRTWIEYIDSRTAVVEEE